MCWHYASLGLYHPSLIQNYLILGRLKFAKVQVYSSFHVLMCYLVYHSIYLIFIFECQFQNLILYLVVCYPNPLIPKSLNLVSVFKFLIFFHFKVCPTVKLNCHCSYFGPRPYCLVSLFA